MTERPFNAEDLGVLIADISRREMDTDDVFEARLEAYVSKTERKAIERGFPLDQARRCAGIAREAARNRWNHLAKATH